MTASDEIPYTDLTLIERAALEAGVLVQAKASADAAGIRARVDADQV